MVLSTHRSRVRAMTYRRVWDFSVRRLRKRHRNCVDEIISEPEFRGVLGLLSGHAAGSISHLRTAPSQEAAAPSSDKERSMKRCGLDFATLVTVLMTAFVLSKACGFSPVRSAPPRHAE